MANINDNLNIYVKTLINETFSKGETRDRHKNVKKKLGK